MDNNKVCFIIIVNDERLYNYCEFNINNLNVPSSMSIEILPIRNVVSIANAYNKAIESCDAKYRVYLHEDLLILNTNLIYDILDIFKDEKIAMIGVSGSKQLPVSGKWWEAKSAVGKFKDMITGDLTISNYGDIDDKYEIVQAIDNQLIITQYDLKWRDDLFDGYYFYDVAQCLEFNNLGYKIVVPNQLKPWSLHNRINNSNPELFEKYQEIFLKNYNLIDIYNDNLFEFDRENAKKQLDLNSKYYNTFINEIKQTLETKNYEEVAKKVYQLSSQIFKNHPGFFASQELEKILQECACNIPTISHNFNFEKSNKRNVLHVMSEGYSTGGHTRLVKHWIKSDPNSTHHLVTTWQNFTNPPWLIDEINASNGYIFDLQSYVNYTEKASVLRDIAYNIADVVVLHVHMMDPTPNIAFGIDGGPPIIFLNHADHCFWLGSSISDLIVDVSETGNNLTNTKRGAKKSFTLPIPLSSTHTNLDRDELRKKYNISCDTKVILTIASEYKFDSINDYDYCEITKTIINNTKDTILMVVGPSNTGKWKILSNVTDGRVIPLGILNDIAEIYQVADIYLEPFMMASYTSRLDAILNGLPLIKFKNNLYPKITDLFSELELLSCNNIAHAISYINEYEKKEGNPVYSKALKMKEFVQRENIDNTTKYINEIYDLVKSHFTLNLQINNEIDDYDLFWSIFEVY